jgi:hypothetical protein
MSPRVVVSIHQGGGMNTLKMKIVFGSSGKKGSAGRRPVEEETMSSMRPVAVPASLLRHTTAATDAQESLRELSRQRRAQIRNRRLKRVAWAMGAAALGYWGIVSLRSPEPAIAAGVPPVSSPTAAPAPSAVNAAAVLAVAPAPAAALPPAPVATTATAPQPAVASAVAPAVAPSVPSLAPSRPPGFLQGGEKVASAAALEPAARCEEDFAHGRWRAAVESCGLAFDTQPGAGLALKIAHAQWSSGKVDRAGTWARKAVELGTDDADAFVLIGHSERQAGDLEGAMAAYRRYLRWSPRGWHARDVRAALRELKAKTAIDADVASAPAPSPS